jgi:hypothetical protein
LKTAARGSRCREHVETSPEAAVVVNCSRDDGKEGKATAHGSCCCAETLNNLNLQSFESVPDHLGSS